VLAAFALGHACFCATPSQDLLEVSFSYATAWLSFFSVLGGYVVAG